MRKNAGVLLDSGEGIKLTEQTSKKTQRICRLMCHIAFLIKHYLLKKNDLHASSLVIVSFELDERKKLIKLH